MRLPEQVARLLADTPARLNEFVQSHEPADYVFLAQGPLFRIANEAMLKMTECSCSYSQVFHSLEFRHGPKSIADRKTLITLFMSETSYGAELKLLRELKNLGATTFVVANAADARTRNVADFFVELALDIPEYARLAAFNIWGQLFGVYTALKKGLNPDSPRNLTPVVILDEQP
jgi:glucosamine--fructose-6-phosphate aminotransferase (isomerizing)